MGDLTRDQVDAWADLLADALQELQRVAMAVNGQRPYVTRQALDAIEGFVARGQALKAAAEAPQPKVLTKAEATEMARPERGAWTWAPAIEAAVSDSWNWSLFPENHFEHGPREWRIARSAIENLYRSGFAVVALGPPVPEAPETSDGF